MARSIREPKRRPGGVYDTESFRNAIHHACDKAFPLPEHLLPRVEVVGKKFIRETRMKWWGRLSAEERKQVSSWRDMNRFNPNQLRHSWATQVRKEYGLEEASARLGHGSIDTTLIYADASIEKASELALKIG